MDIRIKLQHESGMSFMVHVDAAWGGYFATKIKRLRSPHRSGEPYAFAIPLSDYTSDQLKALRDAE